MRLTFHHGLDECGTGVLAGPLVVCLVTVHEDAIGLLTKWGACDSKRSDPEFRQDFFNQVIANQRTHPVPIYFRTVARPPEVIDRIGVWEAWRSAALEAAISAKRGLSFTGECHLYDPPILWVDGKNLIEGLPRDIMVQQPLVRGDESNVVLSTASLLAKHWLDRYWKNVDLTHPGWDFSKHRGSFSPHHLQTLFERGPIQGVHRISIVEKLQGGPRGSSLNHAQP